MKGAIAFVYYAIALIGNVVGWVAIGKNANERYPVLVFVTCILAMALAGFLTVANKGGDWKKWVGWSTFVGVVLACMLVFMV